MIRPARPADAEGIHAVSVASTRAAYEGRLHDETFLRVVDDERRVESLRSFLGEAAGADDVVYLAAADDERVVGFVQLLSGDRVPAGSGGAYLKSLYVHPDRWGEGVGTRLLSAGLDRLPAGVDHVRVAVLSVNDLGREFYEARGFEWLESETFEIGGVSYDTEIYYTKLNHGAYGPNGTK